MINNLSIMFDIMYVYKEYVDYKLIIAFLTIIFGFQPIREISFG